MKEIPLQPQMIAIMNAIATPMNNAQIELTRTRQVFADGLAMCAFQLGLKPEQVEGFDAAKAVFIVKERPDESSAPLSAAVPSGPPSPEPLLHTASQSDLEGTPVPLAP